MSWRYCASEDVSTCPLYTWNFQCLLAYIIHLYSCVFLTRIDIYEFLTHVESGLTDHYDIKMLTYLMIARLANMCPSAVLERE